MARTLEAVGIGTGVGLLGVIPFAIHPLISALFSMILAFVAFALYANKYFAGKVHHKTPFGYRWFASKTGQICIRVSRFPESARRQWRYAYYAFAKDGIFYVKSAHTESNADLPPYTIRLDGKVYTENVCIHMYWTVAQ